MAGQRVAVDRHLGEHVHALGVLGGKTGVDALVRLRVALGVREVLGVDPGAHCREVDRRDRHAHPGRADARRAGGIGHPHPEGALEGLGEGVLDRRRGGRLVVGAVAVEVPLEGGELQADPVRTAGVDRHGPVDDRVDRALDPAEGLGHGGGDDVDDRVGDAAARGRDDLAAGLLDQRGETLVRERPRVDPVDLHGVDLEREARDRLPRVTGHRLGVLRRGVAHGDEDLAHAGAPLELEPGHDAAVDALGAVAAAADDDRVECGAECVDLGGEVQVDPSGIVAGVAARLGVVLIRHEREPGTGRLLVDLLHDRAHVRPHLGDVPAHRTGRVDREHDVDVLARGADLPHGLRHADGRLDGVRVLGVPGDVRVVEVHLLGAEGRVDRAVGPDDPLGLEELVEPALRVARQDARVRLVAGEVARDRVHVGHLDLVGGVPSRRELCLQLGGVLAEGADLLGRVVAEPVVADRVAADLADLRALGEDVVVDIEGEQRIGGEDDLRIVGEFRLEALEDALGVRHDGIEIRVGVVDLLLARDRVAGAEDEALLHDRGELDVVAADGEHDEVAARGHVGQFGGEHDIGGRAAAGEVRQGGVHSLLVEPVHVVVGPVVRAAEEGGVVVVGAGAVAGGVRVAQECDGQRVDVDVDDLAGIAVVGGRGHSDRREGRREGDGAQRGDRSDGSHGEASRFSSR